MEKENKEYLDLMFAHQILSSKFELVCGCEKDKVTVSFEQTVDTMNEIYKCHRCDVVLINKIPIDIELPIRQIDTEADDLIKEINKTYPVIEGGLDHSDISQLLIRIVEFVRRNHNV